MMRPLTTLAAVYLCVEPIDFRLQINGLAARVEGALLLDPLSEQLFAFTNRRYNRVKVLYWERNGFVLWQKHLSTPFSRRQNRIAGLLRKFTAGASAAQCRRVDQLLQL